MFFSNTQIRNYQLYFLMRLLNDFDQTTAFCFDHLVVAISRFLSDMLHCFELLLVDAIRIARLTSVSCITCFLQGGKD